MLAVALDSSATSNATIKIINAKINNSGVDFRYLLKDAFLYIVNDKFNPTYPFYASKF